MCSQLYFFLLINCRCSYLKDDDVGYFAVHTMAGKKQFIVTMIFDVCAVLDETRHSRVMAWWCKLVAVIFNIWSRLDLTASHCSTVCLLIHVQLFCARFCLCFQAFSFIPSAVGVAI